MSDYSTKKPIFEADWFDPMEFLEFLQLDEANPISKSFADKEALDKEKAKEDARAVGGDKKDVDSARKRVERKASEQQEKTNPWKGVIVVKTLDDNKTRLIPKTDYEPNKHELLYGRVPGQRNKPEVTPNAAREISRRPDFEATKTSNRLLGNVEKTEDPSAPEVATQEGEVADDIMDSQEQKRIPSNGKEITSAGSVYPDWDHESEDMASSIASTFNSVNGGKIGDGMSPSLKNNMEESETLEPSAIRVVQQIQDDLRGSWVAKPVNKETGSISPEWASLGGDDPSSKSQIVFEGDSQEEVVRASVRIGETPILLEKEGEALALFSSTALKLKENILLNPATKKQTKAVSEKMRDYVINTKPEVRFNNQIQIDKNRFSKENVENLHTELKSHLEDIFATNEEFKKALVYEELTGQDKFGFDNPSSVTHILSANKDGTSAHLSKLNETYINKIINDVKVNIRFGIDDDIRESRTPGSFWAAMSVSDDMKEDICHHFTDLLAESDSDTETYFNQATSDISDDPFRMFEFLGLTVNEISSNQLNLANYNTNESGEYTKVQTRDRVFYVPVEKDTQYYEAENDEIPQLTTNEEYERDYRKEYDRHHSSKKAIQARGKRTTNRRRAIRKGVVSKGDGVDIDHKDGNPMNNSSTNLRKRSAASNRSDNKHKPGETQDHSKRLKEEGGAGDIGTYDLLKKYIEDTPFMEVDAELNKLFKKNYDRVKSIKKESPK